MAIKYKRQIKIGIVFIIATVVMIWGLMYLKGLEIFALGGGLRAQKVAKSSLSSLNFYVDFS